MKNNIYFRVSEEVYYLTDVPRLQADLQAAFRKQDFAAFRDLVAQGAPIIDEHGNSPIHQAIGDYNRNNPTELDTIARELIRAAGPIATIVRDRNGRTPLHIAALYGNLRIAGLLLSRGANPNIKDDAGNTPLHLARNLDITNQLLRHGADVTRVNDAGETPISTQINVWRQLFER